MSKQHLTTLQGRVSLSSLKNLPVAGKLLLLVLVPLVSTLIIILALTVGGLTRLETDTTTFRLQEEIKLITQEFVQLENNLAINADKLAADFLLLDALQRGDQTALQVVLLSNNIRSADLDYLEVVDTDGRTLNKQQTFVLEETPAELKRLQTLALLEIKATELVPVPQGWLLTVARPLKTKTGLAGGLSVGRVLDNSTLRLLNFERRNPRLVLFDPQGNRYATSDAGTQDNLADTSGVDRSLWGQAANGQVAFGQANIGGEVKRIAYVPLTIGRQVAVFSIQLSTAETTRLRNQLVLTSLVVGGVLALLATGAVFGLGNHFILQPIATLMQGVKRITSGQFEVVISSVTNRDEIGMLASAFNHMTAELQRTLARERAILESAFDCIIVIDHHGQIVEFNRTAERTFGYNRTQILGREISELIVPSSWQGQLQEDLTDCFAVGVQSLIGRQFEITAIDANGSTFPAEMALTIIHSEEQPLFTAFVHDITKRKQAEDRVKASLREKEVLLKEIHHRVKNNLQVISSLLSLQSYYTENTDALKILADSQNRVRSMALIHEKLYQSQSLARIDFAEYIQDLSNYLFRVQTTDTRGITLNIQTDKLFLNIDTAMPCGLILNELVSNALKHAFPDGQKGEIRIEFRANDEGQLTLLVSDNGVGLPPDLDFQNTESLGLELVNTLTDQLEGTIEIHSQDGTEFKITFAL